MLLLLMYLVLGRVLRLAADGPTVAELEVENVVLRHQLAVLGRSVKRPPFRRRDRVLLAAASRLVPRDRWGVFLVSPQTLVRCCVSVGRTRGGAAFGSRVSCASSGSELAQRRSGRS